MRLAPALAVVLLSQVVGYGCGRTELRGGCLCKTGLCDATGRCVECFDATDCEDDVSCTDSRCDDGICRYAPNDQSCPGGQCDATQGCVECTANPCDDGIACTLDRCSAGSCEHLPDNSSCAVGQCLPGQGCVECVLNLDCADGVGCTRDRCEGGRCNHYPDDVLCSDGLTCNSGVGCSGCLGNAECDDGIECTEDRCQAGICRHEPADNLCLPGQHCAPELGCAQCAEDAHCQDELYCNGMETCQAGICVPGTKVICDDGIDCTLEECNEASASCAVTIDPGLCPQDKTCAPLIGCLTEPWLYGHSSGALYFIDLSTAPPSADERGRFSSQVFDIALSTEGSLYGLDGGGSALAQIDPATAVTTGHGSLGINGNGLAFAADGTLYMAGSQLAIVDLATLTAVAVGSFQGRSSSGDIAWSPTGELFLAASGSMGDTLVRVDPTNAQLTPVGPLGFTVWGLAYRDDVLLGLSPNGDLLRIDPNTGQAVSLFDFNIAWWGGT